MDKTLLQVFLCDDDSLGSVATACSLEKSRQLWDYGVKVYSCNSCNMAYANHSIFSV
ncbi:hypothetical protein D3C85_1793270 [compost metagenome]